MEFDKKLPVTDQKIYVFIKDMSDPTEWKDLLPSLIDNFSSGTTIRCTSPLSLL